MLLAGIVSIIASPVIAQEVKLRIPTIEGQLPCQSFVIQRIIDGEKYHTSPKTSITFVKLDNSNIIGGKIKINGKKYSKIQILVSPKGLTCIGTPLDETGTASGR